MTYSEIIQKLKAKRNPRNIAGMARFGINPKNTLGISLPVLRSMAKSIGTDHALALKLWASGIHEARILASIVEDPARVTETQMDSWVAQFDSWDVCDQCCGNLFNKTRFAYRKTVEWSRRKEEFQKRAGFALMAYLAVHDKNANDAAFERFLPLIVRGARDERNFVKKAVNWALRQIGKRNPHLNRAAIRTASEIAKLDSKSALDRRGCLARAQEPSCSNAIAAIAMPIVAIFLVLLAAVFHASYNFLAKSSRDTNAFLWWGVALGAGIYAAFLVISGLGIFLSPASQIFFLVSAVAELGYFAALVRGYAQGDLSLVYPLSRGSAPLFVTLWSGLVMSERLPMLGYVGIAFMIAGVYIASLTADGGAISLGRRALSAPFRNHAARWALASAVFIAIYSLSDREAIKATPPLVYNFWVYFGNMFTWALVVWRRDRVAEILGEFQINWKRLTLGALFSLGSYALVLQAQTIASTSYVVAGRGTSVVIGALLGTLVLREGHGAVRVLSALLMVAGLALIAVG
jgi:3-methyladenine DNA glycosylase AlkD/drug/metabolite transporter (DMT)-like permease